MVKNIPKEHLHTPSELLQGAEFLANSNDPVLWRAAILEAFSALETYVENATSSLIERKSISPFTEWLKNRLDRNLEPRLKMLEDVAIGKPISEQHWKDFLRARDIRNAVTHQGKKISSSEAQFVIKGVYKILAYLGSALELELSLLSLKRHIETNKITVNTEAEAVLLVSNYFGIRKTTYALTKMPKIRKKKGKPKLKCNLVLEFAENQSHVLIETRLVNIPDIQKTFGRRIKDVTPRNRGWGGSYLTIQPDFVDLIDEVNSVLNPLNLSRGIVIGFVKSPPHSTTPPEMIHTMSMAYMSDHMEQLEKFQSVQKYWNDRVFAIAIYVQ